jgi:hypothetical protein
VEQSAFQPEAIVELLEVCLRTTYFQVNDKLFQQKDGIAMGRYPSPVISNIYMEDFKNLANSALHKPLLWLRYVDDTTVVWPHGPEQLQSFLGQLNSLRPTIQFTMEIEPDGVIPFLNVLVTR